jgi:hypothetical protein
VPLPPPLSCCPCTLTRLLSLLAVIRTPLSRTAGRSNYGLGMLVLSASTDHAEMRPQHIIATHDQVGSQMSLVAVEGFRRHGYEGTNPSFSPMVEALEFQVGGHEHGDELSIGSGPCPTTINIGSNIVNFLTILLHNDGSSCGPGISSEHNSSIILHTDDGGACFLMLYLFGCILLEEKLIPT